MLAAAATTVITVTTSRLLTSPSRTWAAHPAADALTPVLYRAAIASLALATASAGILTGWRAIAAGQSWMAIALPALRRGHQRHHPGTPHRPLAGLSRQQLVTSPANQGDECHNPRFGLPAP